VAHCNPLHDNIKTGAGNFTWLNQLSLSIKVSEKSSTEVLLWLFHTLGLYCAIAGEFALYIGGKLVSRPDSIITHIVCHLQNWYSDISVSLQILHSLAFSLGCLDFLFVPECFIPGKMLHYIIRYGVENRALRIVCIDSVKLCGTCSDNELTDYIWSTFEYYCANNAMVLLPSYTSGNKIVYVRHYQAEIGGECSRLCGQCVGITKNTRTY